MNRMTRAFTGQLADSDIRLLRVFCVVTECGGFAAAESELQMGLPSISRYIKDLEIRLGMRLCQRGRIGFALTQQGAQIYDASQRLIRNMEQFEADVRSAHSELTGVLQIGMADTFVTDPRFRLSEVIGQFRRRHPRVAISLNVQTSNTVEQRLLDGSFQAGMIVMRRSMNQLSYRHLYKETCSLYCTNEHPLAVKGAAATIEDLFKHDYAGFGYADDGGRPISGGRGVLQPAAHVDHTEALAILIGSGTFFGYLPDHYVSAMSRPPRLTKILPDLSFASNVAFVTNPGTMPPSLIALITIIDELV